jgi:hypothetical protein
MHTKYDWHSKRVLVTGVYSSHNQGNCYFLEDFLRTQTRNTCQFIKIVLDSHGGLSAHGIVQTNHSTINKN